jgi:lipoate-protein ligase B
MLSVSAFTSSQRARVLYLGTVPYADATAMQRRYQRARIAGEVQDTLLLLQHPPTYTTGSSFRREHLLISEEAVAARGAVLTPADRGGSITYHGPGQLVGYPIFSLCDGEKDVHRYVRNLEAMLIDTLARFDIKSGRQLGRTGVFVEEAKIASIGVRLAKWVTMHGFALNVHTDLTAFDAIVACGLEGCRPTSISRLLGRPVTVEDVLEPVVESLGRACGRHMEWVTQQELTDIPATAAAPSEIAHVEG